MRSKIKYSLIWLAVPYAITIATLYDIFGRYVRSPDKDFLADILFYSIFAILLGFVMRIFFAFIKPIEILMGFDINREFWKRRGALLFILYRSSLFLVVPFSLIAILNRSIIIAFSNELFSDGGLMVLVFIISMMSINNSLSAWNYIVKDKEEEQNLRESLEND